MADDKTTDMIMKFVLGGSAIAAESTTTLNKDLFSPDQFSMLFDFQEGYFFEIEDVNFGIKKPAAASTAGAPQQGAATDLGQIEITRRIDRASLKLLDCCFNAKTLASATVIKRRASGGGVSGEPYLRIDFDGVLITDIAWDDSEVVKEKCTFICRSMKFKYRPQSASGDLGKVRYAEWKQTI